MKKNEDKIVVVLGASKKRDRYSNMAIRLLKKQHYHIIPVHPKLDEIENLQVFHSLEQIHEKVDTLTVYIGPERSEKLIDSVIKLKPRRVILNPGTESPKFENRLIENHIPVVKACTLVLLNSGQF